MTWHVLCQAWYVYDYFSVQRVWSCGVQTVSQYQPFPVRNSIAVSTFHPLRIHLAFCQKINSELFSWEYGNCAYIMSGIP